MKKAILVLTFGLPVLCALGLSVAVVEKAVADSCDPCGCCDDILWDSSPSSVNASNGNFSFNQVVRWYSSVARSQGTIVDGGSTGILSVTWNPELFFPDENCCSGVLTIATSGELNDPDVSGTLRSKAQIVYPFDYQTKVVTINH